MTTHAKLNALKKYLKRNPDTILIAWFEESYRIAATLYEPGLPQVYMARELNSYHLQSRSFLFFEHFPLVSKEDEFIKHLQVNKAVFYSALDEPLFSHFGSERLIQLMKSMGMSDHESIEHLLISSAIKNAREKIGATMAIEASARSQEEWFQRNIPSY